MGIALGECQHMARCAFSSRRRIATRVELSSTMLDSPYVFEADVRDYECDIQGVVNNAVYLHYLEHARHLFLKAGGVDFVALTQAGVNLVVTRMEVDYIASLRGGDRFGVQVTAERVSRLRFGFRQEIFRVSDSKAILRALVIGTALDANGKPHLPGVVEKLLAQAAGPANA